MQDPEIKAKRIVRRKEIKDRQRKELAQHDALWEVLVSIREQCGLDLDVATEVWGEKMLDSSDECGLIERLITLLQDIHDNPGQPLLLLVPYEHRLMEGDSPVYGFTYALIPEVGPESIVYQPPTDSEDAFIAIRSEKALIEDRRGWETQGDSIGRLTHPTPKATDQIALGIGGPRFFGYEQPTFNLASPKISVAYDPSQKDARSLASRASNGWRLAPEEVLRALRP